MIALNPAQQLRLEARTLEHDLARIGAAVTEALRTDVALEPPLLMRAWRRAQAHGLSHALSVGRYLALTALFGEAFEDLPAHAWALQALQRPAPEAAKVYQLGRQAVEALEAGDGTPPGPATERFRQALAHLDQALGPCGAVGTLGDRSPLTATSACDVLALRFDRLHGGHAAPPLLYRHRDGRWCREPAAALPQGWSSTADQPLPEALHLLGAASPTEGSILRLRTRMLGSCAEHDHPSLRHASATGVEVRRGAQALDWRCALPAVALPDGLAVSREPLLQTLSIESCGLRDRGPAWGRQSTCLALYPSAQRLLAWTRGPVETRVWPAAPPRSPVQPAAPLRPITLETDGRPDDAAHWQRGFAALDEQLRDGLSRLFDQWQGIDGMSGAGLEARPRALAGEAGVTWGYQSLEPAWVSPPVLRVAGHLHLCACHLALTLSGTLRRGESHTSLRLRVDGRADWRLSWDSAEDRSAPAPQHEFRLPMALSTEAVTAPGAALAQWTWAGEAPALLGRAGLRERQRGGGLEWYFEASLEPVKVRVTQVDPWTGRLEQSLDLMPGLRLVEWSWS
ncbi:hypothetical protein OOT46_17795 [Aquabacterium sp. A7-Y]|uniref:hypothetical protein n=1 Tax=Aquabacterium sp. A7-Y TaxID=1349605 RepID=UPI00223D429A|nr:hypothetical protein [Aquabacterium sp. A7-Y]MCW7539694.1 hypothetical protein [Aquabacterium sp. A7-Y]